MRQRSLSPMPASWTSPAWVLTTNAQNLPIPNIMARTNLVHTGTGRQKILNKLDRITVAELSSPAFRWAPSQELRISIRSPDGAGVNFLISNGIDQKRAGLDSLYTDLPILTR